MASPDPKPITAAPAKDHLIAHDGKQYTTVREGNAYILIPPNARTSVNPTAKAAAEEEQKVFYNPIQQFNRDLSVLAIKAYGEDLVVRKTAAREVRKKKGEGKKERKKQRKAEESASVGEPVAGRPAHEESKVHDAESTGKRKRADDEEDESEGNVRKVQKAGDSANQSNGATAPSVDSASGVEGSEGHSNATNDQTAAGESHTSDLAQDSTAATHSHPANGTTNPANGESKPWQPSFRILDALSATGLRALRYATEIPAATSIVANDRDRGATAAIALNVQHNDLSSKIHTSTGDAMGHMYAAAFPPPNSHGPNHISGKYDVIDLDPYGTAAPFLDAALQALNDEGMLCVTCTDSGVFASCGYSEKTFALYGGMPVKGNHAHEAGLRLILHAIAQSAAKYSLAIEPLLSLSIDFYARVFVRVRKSAADVKFLAGKTMLVYECDVGCGAWTTQPLGRHQRHGKDLGTWKYHIAMAPASDRACEHCGSRTHVAGPMWGGPLHNAAFVERILAAVETADPEVYHTLPRVEGMLDTALGELRVLSEPPTTSPSTSDSQLIPPTPAHLPDPHPFYVIPSALCKVIKASAPPEAAVRGALRRLGHVATRSHARPGSLKTDAPWAVLWEVMREWVRQRSPVKRENLRAGAPGDRILAGMRTEGDGGKEGNGERGKDGEGKDGEGKDGGGPGRSGRLDVVFDEKLGREEEGRRAGGGGGKKRLVRYQQNPRENWGPMARAKGSAGGPSAEGK